MHLDLASWAVVAFKDDTGLGRMAQDARSVLGLGRQIVIPSQRLETKPIDANCEILLHPEDPPNKVEEALQNLQGIIVLERHGWHPQLLSTAKQLGLKTVCVPMWEWFRGSDPEWKLCDLFITPSQFSLSVIRSFGHNNSISMPWTVDLRRLPARVVTGAARVFVHNAGLVDQDDRKGTRETIEAFTRLNRDDLKLLIRMQKEVPLPVLNDRIEVQIGNFDEPAELYREADVAIQPSKMEGLGLMVLEPVCSGLPTITLDYPPMNEYVKQNEMQVRKRWFKHKAHATNWLKHAHLRLPDVKDIARKIQWCAENDLSEISKQNRQWAEFTFSKERLTLQWTECLQSLMDGQLIEFIDAKRERVS